MITTADQTGLVVKLEPRASVAGKVVDERGAAVAGVHVDLQKDRRGGGISVDWGNRGGALTGIDGGFEMVGLEPGKLKLVVSDDFGVVPFVGANKPLELELSKGQKLTGVTLTIEARDGVIRGVVIGTDKKPVADAWVSARQAVDLASAKRSVAMGFWRESEPILTGSDGTFKLERLHRGSYDIEVEGPKGASRAEKKGVRTGEVVTLVLESLGSITGRVTVGNAPVGEFDLGCHAEGRRCSSEGMSRRFTNADGTYTIERLQPGEYSCSVTSASGTATGKVVVATGPSKLDLALQPWATVTGVVVDAVTNKPVPNLLVLLSGNAMDGKQIADTLAGKGPTTDQNGRFLVERVPVDKGQVHVAPKDASFNHLATRDFTATSGQRIDVGTIKIVMPHDDEGGTLGFFPGVVDGKLVVADVKADTPAERAGVLDDDRITAINGRPVVTGDNAPEGSLTADVGKQILMPGSLPVGQPVQLSLERAGKKIDVTIVADKF